MPASVPLSRGLSGGGARAGGRESHPREDERAERAHGVALADPSPARAGTARPSVCKDARRQRLQPNDADLRGHRAARRRAGPAVPGLAGRAADHGDCAARQRAQQHAARADSRAPIQRTKVRGDDPERRLAQWSLPGQSGRAARVARVPRKHGSGQANASGCQHRGERQGAGKDVAAADRRASGHGRRCATLPSPSAETDPRPPSPPPSGAHRAQSRRPPSLTARCFSQATMCRTTSSARSRAA